MPTKSEAKQYLEHRIKTEKGFSNKMLIDLIIKSCDQKKLEVEVIKWKSKATTTPPKPGTTPPTQQPNKPAPKPPEDWDTDWDDIG